MADSNTNININNNNIENNNENSITTDIRIIWYVTERVVPYHDVGIVDAVIAVSAVVKAGLIDLDADPDVTFENATHFEVDEETKKTHETRVSRP